MRWNFQKLKEVKLEASGNVIPTQPSVFYPEVQFTVTGTNVNDGLYDILHENITYKTAQDGQISISQDGQVTILEGCA